MTGISFYRHDIKSKNKIRGVQKMRVSRKSPEIDADFRPFRNETGESSAIRSHWTRKGNFTLIELLVVIV